MQNLLIARPVLPSQSSMQHAWIITAGQHGYFVCSSVLSAGNCKMCPSWQPYGSKLYLGRPVSGTGVRFCMHCIPAVLSRLIIPKIACADVWWLPRLRVITASEDHWLPAGYRFILFVFVSAWFFSLLCCSASFALTVSSSHVHPAFASLLGWFHARYACCFSAFCLLLASLPFTALLCFSSHMPMQLRDSSFNLPISKWNSPARFEQTHDSNTT